MSINSAIFAYQTNTMRRIESGAFENGHVSLNQFRLIAYLSMAEQAQRVSDISRKTELQASVVSNISNELVECGYIQRVALPDDRRAVWLSLTEEGKVFFEKVAAAILESTMDYHLRNLHEYVSSKSEIDENDVEEFRQFITKSPSELAEEIETFALREQRLRQFLKGRISVNSFYVLLTLETKSKRISAGYLANYLDLDKSAISVCIGELQARKFIESQRSLTDRRKIDLVISSHGSAFIKEAVEIFPELFEIGKKCNETMIRLLFDFTDCIAESHLARFEP